MKKEYFINKPDGDKPIKLFLQDCITGMKQHIQDNTVSIVITSPPYNIGVKYSSYNDNMPMPDYIKWIRKVGYQINRILEPNGSFFLNIGGTLWKPWVPFEIATSLKDLFVL